MLVTLTSSARLVGALFAVLLLAAGCAESGGSASQSGDGDQSTLTLAFMGPLTGDAANIGLHALRGAQLAVEEATAGGNLPVRLELKQLDTQLDPAQAAILTAQVLTDPTIVGIVGPVSSGEVKAIGPTLDQAGMPLITPSASNPQLAQQGWDVFHRLVANDEVQSAELARYLVKGLGAERVAVVHDNTEYGKGLAELTREALKQQGAVIDIFEAIDPKAFDYSATVNRIGASQTPVVFYAGVYAEAGRLLKQLRDQGIAASFVAGDGAKDPGIADAAGRAAEGIRVTCACADPSVRDDPSSKAFTSAFQRRFRRGPGTYSAETYDSANVFIASIRRGARTPAAVLRDLNDVQITFDGLTKKVSFQPNGEIATRTVYVYEFRQGEFRLLGTTDDLAE